MNFDELADKWEEETCIISSVTKKAVHPAYQEIIAMGEAAIPLILQRMKMQGGHWFWALSMITKENPIPRASNGNIPEMREAWLKWGENNGYLK